MVGIFEINSTRIRYRFSISGSITLDGMLLNERINLITISELVQAWCKRQQIQQTFSLFRNCCQHTALSQLSPNFPQVNYATRWALDQKKYNWIIICPHLHLQCESASQISHPIIHIIYEKFCKLFEQKNERTVL